MLLKRKGTPRYEHLEGQRFGRLIALEFAGTTKHRIAKWKCKCDCGNEIITLARSLKRGDTQSCGCLHKEIIGNMQRKKKGVASFNALYYSYQQGAKLRHLQFELSKEEFRLLTSQTCFYCGQEPSQRYGQAKFNGFYIYNGIDRLNPVKGYISDNCVTACGTCNLAKQGLSAKEFLNLVDRIYKLQKEGKI